MKLLYEDLFFKSSFTTCNPIYSVVKRLSNSQNNVFTLGSSKDYFEMFLDDWIVYPLINGFI